ncbi:MULTISPECIES: hypothetical protein [Myroides]|uniref:Sensor of ECF-type sigma factor n=1 Tax=Myroides odoratus TaxID=256 RepID=A0A9Q6Z5R5_MYROD|nr:hypothetical protein [Myroides odoratus]MDH6599789.1 hypothetical protein [Myroides gitamensis]EHQ41378.1 hypothetical protein Myrod_0542 [Myroides odoratus DSM 2801]EKB08751.1 hypothetical protein HMPREF9716_00802 [Myroides odoratus CIP 103059]MCS4238955.1 hypothetical protein [Myroides odoratus]QQT98811.1 hypothetical protein I6I88_11350 [Myroides odoratus]
MKRFLLLLIFLCISSFSQAQQSSDQIKSLKIAHLSSVLNLTSEEAEKFWPIYNTYDNKLSKLRHSEVIHYIKSNETQDIEGLTEKQATEKVQALLTFEEDYCSLRSQFILDSKKILSNKKILLLKKAEDDFNRKLLKKYKDKK